MHVLVAKGLDRYCEKEEAPDVGCRENGPEEVSWERAGRWDYEMPCNICQFKSPTHLSLILIGLYAQCGNESKSFPGMGDKDKLLQGAV